MIDLFGTSLRSAQVLVDSADGVGAGLVARLELISTADPEYAALLSKLASDANASAKAQAAKAIAGRLLVEASNQQLASRSRAGAWGPHEARAAG